MNTILYVGEHSRTYDVRWHSHDHWEMVYCTGGEGTFRFENGLAIDYRQGQAVAIPPKEIHANSGPGGFTNIHLTMDAPTFPYKTAFMVADDADGHMGIAFGQARYYYLSDLKRRELVLVALGELITSYMIVFRDNREISGPVESIRSNIIHNFDAPSFKLDETIRRMPFNYDYLRKQFQEKLGMSPLKYMTNLRMKKARSMLSAAGHHENMTVAEVARSCGFDDPLYFSRVFKKYYGCAPSEFVKGQNNGEQPQDLTRQEEME